MSDDKQVLVRRDDLIDALGALELRITDLETYATEWESAGDPDRAQDRRERAEHLRGVVNRLRARQP